MFKEISRKLAAGDETAADDVLQIRKSYSLLGLFKADAEEYLSRYGAKAEDVPAEVAALAERRWQAKRDKNWAEADSIRARLAELGYEVKDTKDGYTVNKK